MTEEQQAAALQDMTKAMQAAAWHGIALNPFIPVKDRLGAALEALEYYATEMDRYESEVTLLQGRAQVNQERAEAAETALAALRGSPLRMTDDELVMAVVQVKRLTDSLLEAASAANAAAQAALDHNAQAWDEGFEAACHWAEETEDDPRAAAPHNPYQPEPTLKRRP